MSGRPYWNSSGKRAGSQPSCRRTTLTHGGSHRTSPKNAHRRTAIVQYDRGWQPDQAETVAGGGADRRSAKNADRPLNQSREAHPLGLAAPLPRGGAESDAGSAPAATPGSRGLHAPE